MVFRRVVVHDDVDVVDVDAAGGDVGRDEHRELARREVGSDFSRICWRRSPWIAAACTPSLLELLDETVGAALGAHEDERRGWRPGDRGGDLHLVDLVDEHEAVGHLLDGHRRRHHLVKDRVLEVSAHHVIDRAVERRREQQRLVRRGDAAQEPLDLRQESHVGHAIGLVEHDGATSSRRTSPLSMRSISRPGVATSDVGAVGERHGWRSIDAPP